MEKNLNNEQNRCGFYIVYDTVILYCFATSGFSEMIARTTPPPNRVPKISVVTSGAKIILNFE